MGRHCDVQNELERASTGILTEKPKHLSQSSVITLKSKCLERFGETIFSALVIPDFPP